jgi:hypothetical protein
MILVACRELLDERHEVRDVLSEQSAALALHDREKVSILDPEELGSLLDGADLVATLA